MVGMDLVEILHKALAFCWKIIEFPFKIWIHLPWQFRWSVFIFLGGTGAFICYLAWKDRNQWRYYYHED